MNPSQTSYIVIFLSCEEATRRGSAILRTSRREKEFVLQDWFRQRLDEARIAYDEPSRNVYPDFRLVNFAEGYEVKGLEFPGREATFDANSQVPTGRHRGRTIYYVFGRYPPYSEGATEYPIIDLVVCHGDFLNADHEYIHENKALRALGPMGISWFEIARCMSFQPPLLCWMELLDTEPSFCQRMYLCLPSCS